MAAKIDLVTIDPQVDFCDPKSALFVGGADKDMDRLSSFVDKFGEKLDDIHTTLDSHQELHVAHPIMWSDERGKHPDPFTILSFDGPTNAVVGSQFDPKKGAFAPNGHTYRGTRMLLHKKQLEYVKALNKNGRYPLMIWPPHCRIGTPGQCVYPAFAAALENYCKKFMATIDYVTKGSNILTEHYSAIQADVPDPSDPSTQINTHFINILNEADEVLLAGEALSHCVSNSCRDLCNFFPDDSFVKKLVLLTDCTSNVANCEHMGDAFVKEMVKRGMRTTTTKDYLA